MLYTNKTGKLWLAALLHALIHRGSSQMPDQEPAQQLGVKEARFGGHINLYSHCASSKVPSLQSEAVWQVGLDAVCLLSNHICLMSAGWRFEASVLVDNSLYCQHIPFFVHKRAWRYMECSLSQCSSLSQWNNSKCTSKQLLFFTPWRQIPSMNGWSTLAPLSAFPEFL